jgi:hypothetical protein
MNAPENSCSLAVRYLNVAALIAGVVPAIYMGLAVNLLVFECLLLIFQHRHC